MNTPRKIITPVAAPRMSTQSTPVVDERTRQLLQLLGEATLRLAAGEPIDNAPLERYVADLAPSTRNSSLLTVPEVCARLHISRWNFYQLLHSRRLHSVTIGRRRYVRPHDLDRFVIALADQGGAS
jgi:excisionase family DNA binding protein